MFKAGMRAAAAPPAPVVVEAPPSNVFEEAKHRPRPEPKPRADVPVHDVEALLAIVSSIYHFDKGVRLHGTVYPQWKRVSEWMEKIKKLI